MENRDPEHKIETDLLSTINDEDVRVRQLRTEQVVSLGLWANAILALLKLSSGIIGHSQALLADGVNSLSDVVYFIVVRIFVVFSGKPADPEHPYGHHQFESIAALVVGAFVITTGLAIFWDSVNTAFRMLIGTIESDPVRGFTLIVALFTIVLKMVLIIKARNAADKTGSIAISALARDHRNDIFASSGVSIGILFGLAGIPWVDPLAGAIVAILVTKTGIDVLRESSAELMDTVPSQEIDTQIRQHLSRFPGIKQIESIHAHRFGPYFVVNITVGVDGSMSIYKGNKIADAVEEHLLKRMDMLRRVYVHYHPVKLKTGS
ncbi:MAG: cation transporter [Fibrobacter sp.]|nr:cation transporter [Fibrobacter sp.]